MVRGRALFKERFGPTLYPRSYEAQKRREAAVAEHGVEVVHYAIIFGIMAVTKIKVYPSVAHYILHDIYDNIFPVGSGGTNGTPASADPIFGFLNKRTAPASRRARSVSAHGGRRKGAKPRCRAEYRGETGRYKSPVRCAKRMGHRGKHRSGRFTWKG